MSQAPRTTAPDATPAATPGSAGGATLGHPQAAPLDDHDQNHDAGDHVHGPGCDHDHDHSHHQHQAMHPYVRATPKLGRNDPCACGSGQKFKKCCGK